jgi:hypothetical protein
MRAVDNSGDLNASADGDDGGYSNDNKQKQGILIILE